MFIDLTMIISTLIAQCPLIAALVLTLILYVERRLNNVVSSIDKRFGDIEKRFHNIDKRFDDIEKRLSGIDVKLSEFSKSLNMIIDFNEILLSIHVSKGLVTNVEYKALSTLLLRARPTTSSKYYTKEVYERLGQLLQKDPDELTWNDIFELEQICELPLKESVESNKLELARYAGKLKALIAEVIRSTACSTVPNPAIANLDEDSKTFNACAASKIPADTT